MDADPMSLNVLAWARVLLRSLYFRASIALSNPCSITHDELHRENWPLNTDGTGLLVILHGYRANRAATHAKVAVVHGALADRNFRAIYAPHCTYEGDDGSLLALDGNLPILAHLREFCADHPYEPLLLVGESAGGRLAVALANALRHVDHTRIHVLTLAAPLNGTSLLTLLPGCGGLWRRALSVRAAAEFDPASPSQLVLANMLLSANPLHSFCHAYSDTDWLVLPPHRCVLPSARSSTLPLGHVAHHEVLTCPATLSYLTHFAFPQSPLAS